MFRFFGILNSLYKKWIKTRFQPQTIFKMLYFIFIIVVDFIFLLMSILSWCNLNDTAKSTIENKRKFFQCCNIWSHTWAFSEKWSKYLSHASMTLKEHHSHLTTHLQSQDGNLNANESELNVLMKPFLFLLSLLIWLSINSAY